MEVTATQSGPRSARVWATQLRNDRPPESGQMAASSALPPRGEPRGGGPLNARAGRARR